MWFFFALTAAWLQASVRLINQYHQLPGIRLVFASKIIKTLCVLPLLLFIEWPQNPWFYLLLCASAPLAVYQDKSILDFTARYGAGTVTRIEPLSVPVVFVLWMVLHPALLVAYAQTPLWFAAICGCIVFAVICALQMRKSDMSAGALRAMIPLLLCISALNMVSKSAVDLAPDSNGIMAYVLIQSALMVAISGFFNRDLVRQPMSLLSDKAILKVGFILSMLTICIMVLRLTGFMFAANPAYVTAVMLTSPFWVILYYKIVKHEEKGDIRAGAGIVLSAIVLTAVIALSGH